MTPKKPAGAGAPDTMLQDYAQALDVALRAFQDAKNNRKGPEFIDARAREYMRMQQLYWAMEHEASRRKKAKTSAELPRKKNPLRQKMIEVFAVFRATDRTLNEALTAMQQDAHSGLTVRYEGRGTYRVEDDNATEDSTRLWETKAIEAMWTEAGKKLS